MNTAAPRVAVVVTTWNGLSDVLPCLASFSQVEYPNYAVVVVDNASDDETVSTVRERFPGVTLLVNETNRGYAGGTNVGMRHALEHGAEYVFILNNDTKMTPPVLDELVNVMRTDPRIAIAGAKNLLMDDPTHTWGKYGEVTWGPLLVRIVGHLAPDRPEPSPTDVEWVLGNGCMMSREALLHVGLFDETFFQVHEDVDWAVRARRLGYRIVYVDTAHIYHRGAASWDPRKPVRFSYRYLLGRNAITFARKYANAAQWAKLLTLMALGLVLRVALQGAYFAFGGVRGQIPWVKGVADGFRHQLHREQTISYSRLGPRVGTGAPIHRLLRWIGP